MSGMRILITATLVAFSVLAFVGIAVIVQVTGNPDVVISGGEVSLSFSRIPILGAPPFGWREVGCWSPGTQGTLPSNVNVRRLTWTAPRNTSGAQQECRIEATVSNSIGPYTYSTVYAQKIGAEALPVSSLAASLKLDPAVGRETEDFVELTWRHNGQVVDHFDTYKSLNAGPMSYITQSRCSPNCTYIDMDAPLGDGNSTTYQVDAIGPGLTAGANRRGGAQPGPTVSVNGLSAPTMLLAYFSCPNSPCFTWVDNSNQETGFKIYLQDKDNGLLTSTYAVVGTVPANTESTDAVILPCPVCQSERDRKLKVVAIRGSEESRGASGVLMDLH